MRRKKLSRSARQDPLSALRGRYQRCPNQAKDLFCRFDFRQQGSSGGGTLYHLSSRCGITPEQFWLIKGLVTQHSADHRQQTVSYRSQRPCMPMASKA